MVAFERCLKVSKLVVLVCMEASRAVSSAGELNIPDRLDRGCEPHVFDVSVITAACARASHPRVKSRVKEMSCVHSCLVS